MEGPKYNLNNVSYDHFSDWLPRPHPVSCPATARKRLEPSKATDWTLDKVLRDLGIAAMDPCASNFPHMGIHRKCLNLSSKTCLDQGAPTWHQCRVHQSHLWKNSGGTAYTIYIHIL